MHPQATIEEEHELSPSFNCYSSESLTSRSIAKVMREEQHALQFHQNDDLELQDFQFSSLLNDDVDHASRGFITFPVFNRDLINDDVNREIKPRVDENRDIHASFAVHFPVFNVDLVNDEVDHEIKPKTDENREIDALRKLFVDDLDESSSYSSSEIDELENIPSGTFCVWRPNITGETDTSSAVMAKCKKSSSTGSGSKRWRIRYLLRRSNSEGKERMVLLSSEQKGSSSEVSKQKRSSGEVLKVAGRWKAGTPVHEQFYVQRRAENEVGKRKSYLPYRKDLVGLFANVNGLGKMLPF
ncbi:hypothetical protein Hanom_Chr15g01379781 [Helianthus anomalus]